MKPIIIMGLILLPWSSFAAKDCRVVEFPDHTEVVCAGKPDNTPVQTEEAVSNPSLTTGAQVSRKRRQLEGIRSQNAHRFDAEESPSAPDAGDKTKREKLRTQEER